jgi:NADH-quinone oxidoreductase subunit D
MTRVTIPVGPQHPLLKEPLSFRLTAEGERVLDAGMRLGYVHRGIERLVEERSYVQNLHLLERVCGICSHVHTTTYCQGVEALLELEVPPRGLVLRTLMCELERIHSHLLWLGVLAENIGFSTIFMYSWRDREIALDIMENLSGGRIAHAVNRIGGVRIDLALDQIYVARRGLSELQKQVEDLLDVVEHESTLKVRTQGIGGASMEQVRCHCAVGPLARAAGFDRDLRRDAPYAAYDRLSFEVVTESGGDVWAATRVRILEILESLSMCHQILADLPSGEVSTRAPRRVPEGEVVSRAEAPRGEVVYYIRSDGSDSPARIKIRTPTLPALSLVREQLRDINVADMPAVISGVDLCIACADR